MIDVTAVKEAVTLEEAFDFCELAWPVSARKHPVIRCPIHEEKTPSFTLYPEDNRWWCYGCNRGGDVVDLVQQVKGISFTDALRELADYAGVAESDARLLDGRPANPATTLKVVADQAHADVLGWVKARQSLLAAKQNGKTALLKLAEEAFADYDETMRAERAGEITPNEAIRALVAWRMNWKMKFK